jgi:hypothetical protein
VRGMRQQLGQVTRSLRRAAQLETAVNASIRGLPFEDRAGVLAKGTGMSAPRSKGCVGYGRVFGAYPTLGLVIETGQSSLATSPIQECSV